MEASLNLGRIRGIPIGIHSTWLIVFGLLTYSLSDRIFPSQYPGWSEAQYWIVGATAALLLFASVVAHELGHAVTAQAKGIGVRSITLFIFGGVAVLDEESEEAGDEFWIAVAGPAVSVAVAALAGLLWVVVRDASEPAAAILLYLATMNLLLVGFNLIPAFPLDGGRVFRAAIWKATNDVQRATRIAGSVGMLIGYVFIVGGILLVFQAPISGIWLVAIGWFLRSAAQQSVQQLTTKRVFEGVRVASLMNPRPVVVGPDATLAELITGYIMGRNVRGVPVVDDGHLVGIITLTDIREVPNQDWTRLRVRDRMTPRESLITATPETDLESVIRTMSERDIHQVPVIHDGTLAGLLTRNAVIRFLQLRQAFPGVEPVPETPAVDRGGRRPVA